MGKLRLPIVLAAVIATMAFNVGMAHGAEQDGQTTAGQAICGADLCGESTPQDLDYRDWDGIGGCHKNNLANPYFYLHDPNASYYNIGKESDRDGASWWVVDPYGPPQGNGTCPDDSSFVLAKTHFFVNSSVLPTGLDDVHQLPPCDNNRNPCSSWRTAFFVELTPISVSAGGSMDTRFNP